MVKAPGPQPLPSMGGGHHTGPGESMPRLNNHGVLRTSRGNLGPWSGPPLISAHRCPLFKSYVKGPGAADRDGDMQTRGPMPIPAPRDWLRPKLDQAVWPEPREPVLLLAPNERRRAVVGVALVPPSDDRASDPTVVAIVDSACIETIFRILRSASAYGGCTIAAMGGGTAPVLLGNTPLPNVARATSGLFGTSWCDPKGDLRGTSPCTAAVLAGLRRGVCVRGVVAARCASSRPEQLWERVIVRKAVAVGTPRTAATVPRGVPAWTAARPISRATALRLVMAAGGRRRPSVARGGSRGVIRGTTGAVCG